MMCLLDVALGFLLLLMMGNSVEESLSMVLVIGGKILVVCGTIIAMIYISTIVHEFGHAFVGTLYGLQLKMFIVGPLALDFTSNRVRVSRFRIGRVGGAVLFDPSDQPLPEAVVTWKNMALAGPLANFAVAGLLAAVTFGMFSDPWSDQRRLLELIAISVFVGFVNLIPKRVGFLATDGEKYRRMRRGGPAAENEIRAQQLAAWFLRPERPAERPMRCVMLADELIRTPKDFGTSETKILSACFLYDYFIDRGDPANAIAWVEWTATAVDHPHKPGRGHAIDVLTAIRARHYALWNNDPLRSELTLGTLHKRSWIRTHTEWMLPTALIQLFHGDQKGALRTIKLARKTLSPLHSRSGSAQLESRWFDIVEQRINNAQHYQFPPVVLTESAAD
jgi:hypothetical protein